MRIRNIISLLALIYAAKSIAADCHIKAWDKIYYLSKNDVSASSVIQESNCDEKTQIQFIRSLLDFEGTIQSSYLRDDLKNVQITPARLTVDSLSNLLAQRLEMNSDYRWDDLKSTNKKVITLGKFDAIHPKLTSRSLGRKTIGLSINNPMEGSERTIWITGTLKTKVTALLAKSHIANTFGEISPQSFVQKIVFTAFPERIFKDKKRLSHYRLNRPLTQGQVLKRSDTTALPLVRVGVPTSISLNAKGIKLNGKALPMSMGKFGDIIQLKSLKSKKTLTGRVVDFNKVVIEL